MVTKRDKKVNFLDLKDRKKLTTSTLIFRSEFHKYRKIFRAIFIRLLLIGHCSIAIHLAGAIDWKYNIIFAPCLLLFMIEAATIIYYRWGCEWKRICTCFCVYLLTIVPVLWILRLHGSDEENSKKKEAVNCTMAPVMPDVNETDITDALSSKALAAVLTEDTTSLLEQSMMFLIIICRWLLPRGRIDRNSLSQLLIMYSAISADILDFSEIFDKDQIKHSSSFRYVLLGVWSWSLLQFTVVLTTSFAIRRQQHQSGPEQDSQDKSEIFSILMAIFLQDGPFLVARCYAILNLLIFEYLTLFYSLKNLLTLILGVYRLLVLCGCISREGNDLLRKSEIARSMESLDELDSVHSIPTKKGKKKKSKDKISKY